MRIYAAVQKHENMRGFEIEKPNHHILSITAQEMCGCRYHDERKPMCEHLRIVMRFRSSVGSFIILRHKENQLTSTIRISRDSTIPTP